MSKPTVGTPVWYRFEGKQEQPYPAQVCFVHPDGGRVNLGGFTDQGKPFAELNVPLWDGQGTRPSGPHAEAAHEDQVSDKQVAASEKQIEASQKQIEASGKK